MPGCAAIGCNNRSEKGYTMKCFPRDPKLRKIWKERVGRADWEPSNNSFLCHAHFEPEQWAVTHSGRLRLRRDAVPSIFTITSTRKSPKKRKQWNDSRSEGMWNGEYVVEYLEDDIEYSSVISCDERSTDKSDSQNDSKSNSLLTHSNQKKNSKKINTKEKQYQASTEYKIVSEKDMKDLEKENIIIVSDEQDREIGKLVRDNFIVVADENDREIGKLVPNDDVLLERNTDTPKIKKELDSNEECIQDNDYDDIEQRLEQICDGGTNLKNSYAKKLHVERQSEIMKECEIGSAIEESIEKSFGLKSNSSLCNQPKRKLTQTCLDKEISENVEIIFGSQNENNSTASSNNGKPAVSLEPENADVNGLSQMLSEDVEENFNENEVHVIPNFRAAMKRKRRTREEIMKSIEKTLGRTVETRVNTSKDCGSMFRSPKMRSERDKGIGQVRTELRRPNNLTTEPEEEEELNAKKKTKFTIKVTGGTEDVSEIIEGLGSKDDVGKEINVPCRDRAGNDFITSIITVQNRSKDNLKDKDAKEIGNDSTNLRSRLEDECISSPTTPTISSDKKCSFKSEHRLLRTQRCVSNKNNTAAFTERSSDVQDLDVSTPNQRLNRVSEDNGKSSHACDSVRLCKQLQEKVNIQREVIARLVNQLIRYKDIESKVNAQLKAKDKEVAMWKHKCNSELMRRVSVLEESDKKLMKTIAVETQLTRKLEGQIKQKDERIKELNWKLDKASKFLDRAEKNTNTYKRKMLNMQTTMRRQKLLEEKHNQFQEMFIDSTTQEFSEEALKMAMDVKTTCGRKCYEKLLTYNFPFPSLKTLRKKFLEINTEGEDGDWGDDDLEEDVLVDKTNSTVKVSTAKKNITKMNEDIVEDDQQTETVTGTVQDIFDENNDIDEFNTNELREHVMLQFGDSMYSEPSQ